MLMVNDGTLLDVVVRAGQDPHLALQLIHYTHNTHIDGIFVHRGELKKNRGKISKEKNSKTAFPS